MSLQDNTNATLDGYIDYLYSRKSTDTQKECLPLLQGIDVLTSDVIKVVTSCKSANKTENYTNMCYENGRGDTVLPVIGNDQEIYKNLYCARCNDVYAYENLPFQILCNSSESLRNKDFRNCVTRKKLDTVHLCQTNIDRQCPYLNPYYKACHLYQALITTNGTPPTIVANPHCLWCRYGYNPLNPQRWVYEICFLPANEPKYPERHFGTMFVIDIKRYRNCSNGYLWNKDVTTCSALNCNYGFIKHGQQCVKVMFPYKEFFHLDDNAIRTKFVLLNYLCEYRKYDRKNCFCSCKNSCWYDNSCCIDKYWNDYIVQQYAVSSLFDTITLDGYLQRIYSMKSKFKQEQCLPLIQNPEILASDYATMIVSCLGKNKTRYDTNMCYYNGRGETLLPVIGIDDQTYKNRHCARCNGVYEHKDLKVDVICNSKKSLNDRVLGGCVTRFNKSKIDCTNFVSKCPYSHPYYKACNSYRALTVSNRTWRYWRGDTVSANPHCLWCVEGQSQIDLNNSQYKPCVDILSGKDYPEQFFVYSFIMNLGENKSCRKETVWDRTTKKCSKFQCQRGYVKQQNRCVKIGEIKRIGESYSECMMQNYSIIVLANENISHPSCGMNAGTKISQISKCVKHIFWLRDDISIKDLNNESSVFVAAPTILKDVNYDIKSLNEAWIAFWKTGEMKDKLYISSTAIQMSNAVFGYDITKNFPNSKTCFKPIVSPASNFIFNSNCRISDKSTGYSIEHNNYVLLSELTEKGYAESVVTCKTFYSHSNCAQKQLQNGSYTLLPDGRVQIEQLILLPSEYSPTETGITFCIQSKLLRPGWFSILKKVKKNLMITGISIGVICYATLTLVYSSTKKLRGIPSLLLMSLCVTLCLTDVCMLVLTTGNFRDGYKPLAIILHFLLLTTLLWIVITAYEYFSTFSMSLRIRDARNMKRFICYLSMAVFFPSVVVAITATIDHFNHERVGYGIKSESFIVNINARLASYIVPLAITFLVSLILLTITIYSLHKHKESTNEATGRQCSLTKMSLKLALLLGVIEIIGFVQIPNPVKESAFIFNAIFMLLFTLARSFRGLLIFLLYVTKKDLMQLVRIKLPSLIFPNHTGDTSQSNNLDAYHAGLGNKTATSKM